MDLDSEARRLLDLTREARTPTARDRARVDRMLGAAVFLGAASTAHAGAAATKAAAAASSAKWLVVVGVAAGVGAGGYFAFQGPATPEPRVATRAAPGERSAEQPPAAPVAGTKPATVAAGTDVRAAAPAVAEPRAKPSKSTLSEELDLLHDAQARWRKGDAAGALGLLAEHGKRFPRSQLVPERDALRVLALCAVGRGSEARALASRFLRTAPRSPLRTSVEESCAGSGSK